LGEGTRGASGGWKNAQSNYGTITMQQERRHLHRDRASDAGGEKKYEKKTSKTSVPKKTAPVAGRREKHAWGGGRYRGGKGKGTRKPTETGPGERGPESEETRLERKREKKKTGNPHLPNELFKEKRYFITLRDQPSGL